MGTIGDNIRSLREAADMSQSDLARILGKTRAAVSQWENGVTVPRMGVIERLSEIFRVPKTVVIGDTALSGGLSADEIALLTYYAAMGADDKSALLRTARALAKTGEAHA